MIEAAIFAEQAGLAFNRHWTVHYQMAGINEREGADFVGRLLTQFRKHMRRCAGEGAALWCRENGDGKGGHVHILLHVPRGATLRNLTRRWIRAAGGKAVRRVSRVRTIRSVGYRANADAVLAYLLKAADGVTGRALGLPRYDEPGLVIGKRAGWTQNIGGSARARKQR